MGSVGRHENIELITFSEVESVSPAAGSPSSPGQEEPQEMSIKWQRVLYTMEKRKLTKKKI